MFFLNKCIVPTIPGFSLLLFVFAIQVRLVYLVGSKTLLKMSGFIAKMTSGGDGTGISKTATELYVTILTKGKGSW